MSGDEHQVFGGRYELGEQIARGGTAQVFVARDLLLGRPVALKVLISELSSDHAFVARFRREAQAAANLSHPNIVPIFDWGEEETTYYIVMEYVDGEALSSIIHTQAPLAPKQAASITADIAKALSYAHRHGVVHRDVKPGNVLITSDGQVKVTDFGIARAMGVDEQVTRTGLVMGTATYFSPEQAQGLGVDGRSDVYSLGVVLYEMVTGRAPFSGESPISIAYQHVRERPTAPRALNPAVPAALEAVILQAMAKSPDERYQSADAMRADLDRFSRGQPVLAKAPANEPATVAVPVGAAVSEPEAPEDGEGRRTTPAWLVAGALLLVALGLVIYFGGYALGYFGASPYYRVPDVRHMQAKAALAKLDHFDTVFKKVKATSSDSGTVVRQDPSGGTLQRHATVVLYVAGAPPKGTVPTVTSLDPKAAEARLHDAGFHWKVQDVEATTQDEPQDQVAGQVPPAGASVPLHSLVTIDVVHGYKKSPVPKLAGLSEDAAESAIKNAGFSLGNVTQQASQSVPAGTVISSSPAAATPEVPGTAISLVISEGNLIPIPDVYGDQLQEAEQTLTSVGLTYDVIPQSGVESDQIGIVVRQAPQPGKAVRADHPVKLYVGVASSSGPTPPTAPTGPSST